MGFYLAFSCAFETGFYPRNPAIIILDILYWVLIGPSLYVYIDLVTTSGKKLKWKYLWHLIPTAVVLIGFHEMYIGKDVILLTEYKANNAFEKFAVYVWYFNSPLYYVVCILKIRSHRQRVKNYYSYTKNVDLKWLNYLVYGFAAYLLYGFIRNVLFMFFKIQMPAEIFTYSWLIMVLYIFGIGLFGFRQRGVFADSHKKTTEENTSKLAEPHYEKSGLSNVESKQILERLKELMKTEKPYVDSELNLRHLAQAIGTTSHKLSQVINEQLNCNFFEFVNKYRIEEAKTALLAPENKDLKIIAIAYDCGFNSKSTFYTAFKKITSQTPSEYRQQAS